MDDTYGPKPFDPISSFSHVEDMTLPALTLNLLDRRLSLAAGMDLLMRRLNEKLDVTNLFITSFQEDYQTASVRYFFGPIPCIDESAVFPLSREAVNTLQRFGEQGLVHPVSEMPHLRHVRRDARLRQRHRVPHDERGEILGVRVLPERRGQGLRRR